ncbi:MAG: DNA-directed RNA polymerase subunit beta' [Actinobacteria bacterium]|uniref:DNA-directed RNA polymerase n=1 Tax=freshwater metagenome TaxID=449393 RepID=A0A6J7DLS2_9ZZZZ|nr:DNA-directed RNA polymerase subunit beta' [Actinomycetota bacterium]
MIDINNFDAIEIGLASSKQIRSWSSGEVTKPETINYRTLKPERDGLFCERIFGPQKDWECNCGKYKRVRYKGIVCERCGVEVTRSKVRRERMGHIDLAAPVSHIWFFKGVPSRIGYLLDMAPKDLDRVLYFAASVITSVDVDARDKDLDKLEKEVLKLVDESKATGHTQVSSLEESVARREEYLTTGKTPKGFSEDDMLWADTLELDLSKASDEERDREIKEMLKSGKAEIQDNADYYEDSAQLVLDAWEQFKTIKPKEVVDSEPVFRRMVDLFGSPYGLGEYFTGGMGAQSVRDLLDAVDLEAERIELDEIVREGKGQKQQRAVKRLKVVSAFLNSDNKPGMMILEAVPVIPPELRPMVPLDGGRFAASDLNDLYRRVINRNNRLKRLLDLGAPEIIVNNEKRMLQEAVDNLFDNGRRGRAVTGPGNRALKSLSDMLKGKQGRFRQNLLGKRVDYSGRSVIVAGPSLKLHQCGLPKLIAIELFKPFIMAKLVERRSAQNIKAAKKMVESEIPEVWDVLEEVIHEHPVLLNRAPTLHRLGIQAFEPVLVEGKAIQVHPMVCAAFNADFDGDQMAVHVPLSAEAQAEARILMLSSNNILSPSNGQPLATPTQDMVLGAYYLTYGPEEEELAALEADLFAGKWPKGEARPRVYRTAQEAEWAYEHRVVKLHDLAEFRPMHAKGGHKLTTIGRVIYNDRIERALEEALGEHFDPLSYEFANRSMKKKDTAAFVDDLVHEYGASTISQVLDAFKDLGFEFATKAGITISKNDVVVPPEKAAILERFDAEVSEIQEQYAMGLITQEERHEAVTGKWTDATDEVGEAMKDNLHVLNPIFMMANSGARGSFSQIRQLAGMRGLMANPKGEIIERPIKSNFMEGLTVLEYFISTHGARKGLADTALRTADSGYLTRRLVDVSQDVIIREQDCKTKDEPVIMSVLDDRAAANQQLIGRVTATKVETKAGKEVIAKGVEIGREELAEIVAAFAAEEGASFGVRSVLNCRAEVGVCRACYGRSPASGKLAEIGDAVGIIAAQSIGEPGTQLTMRTFHTGGVAGADITHGLPRVVELFEARKPKGVASIAKIDGKVSIERGEKSIAIQVYNGSKPDPEDTDNQYEFPLRTRLLVEEGDTVAAGTQITEGSLYPAELLELRGRTETALYLVDEVQRVYKAQGVDIDNRHIELIVRQMLKKVRVDQRGDSDYLPGQYVDRTVFADACAVIKKSKGEQPQYEEIILGITKASLNTDSFLSAASFQETTKVLTDAALEGRRDRLMGLKENVIIGKLIPAATGLQTYRRVEITPTEPLPAAYGAGSLSEEELAVLGLEPGGDLPGENLPGDAVGTDVLGDLNRSMGAGADGRADELASELPE